MSWAGFLNSPFLIVFLSIIPLVIGFIKKREYFLALFLPAESVTIFIGQLVKKITAYPRPFLKDPQVLGIHTNIPQDYSFPSLHTAVVTIFAWILTFIFPELSWLWFAILVVVAYSRVALGLHYPQDIFGGFFIATFIFWGIYLMAQSKKALAWKKNPNIRRKIIHLFYGFLLVFLLDYQILSRRLFFYWLIAVLFIVLISPFLPSGIRKIISYFERNKKAKFLVIGPLLFTLSAFTSWMIFPRNIALAAILNLAIGDSVNALTGSFLQNSGQKKRLEAAIASFFAVTLITSQYVPLIPAVTGGLVTLALEFSEPKIKGKKIDDNLLIPLFSGLAILTVIKII